MSVVEIAPSGGDDKAALQAVLDAGNSLQLQAGGTYQGITSLTVRDGQKILGDAGNPPTLQRPNNTTSDRLVVINGRDVTLANFKVDYNMASGWVYFLAGLTFLNRQQETDPTGTIQNVNIANIEFFDSAEAVDPGGGDVWGIVFTHKSATQISDITITGCRSVSGQHQLTAGGGFSPGCNNVTIQDCWVTGGKSNAIAVSSRGGADGGSATISNLTIRRNTIIDAFKVGVFVGMDANNRGYDVTLSNIDISDNYIEMSGERTFQECILIKSGDSDANGVTGLTITDNYLDTRKPSQFFDTLTPRHIVAKGRSDATNEITFTGNRVQGTWKKIVNNYTKTQSDNQIIFGDEVTI